MAVTHPVEGALVNAQQVGGLQAMSGAVSDSGGGYQINQSLGPGTYNVTAGAFGYLSSSRLGDVNSTSDVQRLDFDLGRSGLIWGRVLGFDGNPIVGAVVTLESSTSGSTVGATYTDENGSYFFADGIATGNYIVSADFQFPFEYGASQVLLGGNYSGPTFSYPDAPYMVPGYLGLSSGYVSVANGTSVEAPELVLLKSGVITGSVTDQQGRSIANAALEVTSTNEPPHFYITNSTGQFTAAYDLTAGTCNVTPVALGYAGSTSTVTMSAGGTANVSIQMFQSATVKGRVTRLSDGTPIPGAFVDLKSLDGVYNQVAATGSDGSYAISSGLGPDSYNLTLTMGTQTLASMALNLTAGQAASQDLATDVFFLSGTVRANSTTGPGVPSADVSLTYSGPSGSASYASSDAQGVYRLVVPVVNGTGGETAQATLTASASGFNVTSLSLNLTIGTDASKDLVLIPAASGQGGAPSATITGTVDGEDGPSLPLSTMLWNVFDPAGAYSVEINGTGVMLNVLGNSAQGMLSMVVAGPAGTTGQMTIYLPASYYSGPFAVSSSLAETPTVVSQGLQGSRDAITLSYAQGVQTLTLTKSVPVPEFPGALAMAAVGAACAVALFCERKLRTSDPGSPPGGVLLWD